MANFVLLYTGGSMPESEAEQAAVMQAWTAWLGGLGSALVDGGNPFTSQAKSIASNGKVSDGPVGTMATGYSILKADSLGAASSGSFVTIWSTMTPQTVPCLNTRRCSLFKH